MEFVRGECELKCFDIDSIADEVEAMDDDTDLKQLIKKMMGHIQKQDQELKSLRRNQTIMNEEIIDNTNALNKLNGRVVELEKYSRTLCPIFFQHRGSWRCSNEYYLFIQQPPPDKHQFFAVYSVPSTEPKPRRSSYCQVHIPC